MAVAWFIVIFIGIVAANVLGVISVTKPTFSQEQFDALSKLAEHTTINESGFLASRGFTDNFGPSGSRKTPFVVTEGNISSSRVAANGVITTTPDGAVNLTPPEPGSGLQFLQTDGNGGVFWGDGVDDSVVEGKVNKAGDTMTGVLTSTNTTDATSAGTGSVILNGGLGVGRTIHAGRNVVADGTLFGLSVNLNGSLTTLRKTNPDSLGDNRVHWENRTNRPTWGLLGPVVASPTNPCASVRFGVGYATIQAASLDYIFNGSDNSVALTGGNLNAITMSHTGQSSQLSLFADGQSVFPRGDLAASKQSWFEAWWAAQSLNTLNGARNLNGGFTIPVTGTNIFSGAPVATGMHSTVPVTTDGADPQFEFNGLTSLEWTQTTNVAAAPLVNPVGKRVTWLYNGLKQRRFEVVIQGTYKSTAVTPTPPARNLFQCLMRTNAVGATQLVNGTASAWSEASSAFPEMLFSVVSKRKILVSPGDVFEVAVGFHPISALPVTNAVLVCPELSISFVAMLNNT